MDHGHCSGPEALSLVSALFPALGSGSQTPDLGRAARSWGTTFSAPVEALAALSALRKVVVDAARAPLAGSALFGLPVTVDSANGVVDQLMLEAVDAASANLRTLARTDPLTGCANRLALREDLSYAAGAAARSGLDLSVVALDLDGLKKINDTRGHAAGDAALRALVARLSAELRDADTLYRTGGDEFVVVAPFTDAAGAAAMLERASGGGGPSFSWGIASMRAMGARAAENPELLTAAADSDLYARRRRTRRRRASGEKRHRAMNARTAVALAGTQVHSTMSSLKRHRRLVTSFAASAILAAAAAGALMVGLSHGTRPSGRALVSRAPVQRHRAPSAVEEQPSGARADRAEPRQRRTEPRQPRTGPRPRWSANVGPGQLGPGHLCPGNDSFHTDKCGDGPRAIGCSVAGHRLFRERFSGHCLFRHRFA